MRGGQSSGFKRAYHYHAPAPHAINTQTHLVCVLQIVGLRQSMLIFKCAHHYHAPAPHDITPHLVSVLQIVGVRECVAVREGGRLKEVQQRPQLTQVVLCVLCVPYASVCEQSGDSLLGQQLLPKQGHCSSR